MTAAGPARRTAGLSIAALAAVLILVDCTFTGNEVFGGNGGNGANGYVDKSIMSITGAVAAAAGSMMSTIEQLLIRVLFGSAPDRRTIGTAGPTTAMPTNMAHTLTIGEFYGEYDIDVWAEWFNWGDSYSSWEEFSVAYLNDEYDPLGDPYDQMMDVWRYSGYGGAVYCELDSDATFVDCVFEDNHSHGGLTGIGGYIFAETSRPDRQLNMPTAGGAVFAAHDSDLTFENCRFKNNTADISTVDLPHSFQVSFGGAVAYEFGCEVSFTGCDISQNNATVGGGIYGYSSTVEIADCNVFDNEAYLGAGVYLDDEAAVVSRTLVHANQAKVPDEVVDTGEEEEDPPADDEPVVPVAAIDQTGEGAGIYAHVLDLQIRDSVFVENRAELSGGGLMLSGTVDEQSDVFNCLFAQNRALRDGGGASVNWSSNAAFTNCTFADNSSLGSDVLGYAGAGGGLYCGYDSIVNMLDSIFWGNGASQGTQIAIGSSERPSKLTIAYANVAGYPSANAIYVAPDCMLNINGPISNNAFSDPDDAFLTSPIAAADDVSAQYYLDQELSPWKDAGSRTSIEAGLGGYTTSIYGARDKGTVDLGYHYLISARSQCSTIDEALVLDGQIDLADLASFLVEWLSEGCSEGNNWCDGSDLNYDGDVDFDDMAKMSACWLEEDTEIPYPSPAEWELQPKAVAGTFGLIEMAAKIHHDLWWPDEYIRYRFYVGPESNPDVLIVEQDANQDGWLTFNELGPSSMDEDEETVVQIYATKTGLAPGSYLLYVQAEDGSGYRTELSETLEPVAPGSATAIPAAQWTAVPESTVINGNQIVVAMEAAAYSSLAGVPTLPTGYTAKYQFEKDNNLEPYQESPVWVDEDVIVGETHTYRVRIGIFHESSTEVIAESAFTPLATVDVITPDLTPPTPNPAQHFAPPVYLYVSSEARYYHRVWAVVAVDAGSPDVTDAQGNVIADVEYYFDCSDNDFDSGWRSVASVADTTYTDGSPQVPYLYEVSVGLSERDDLYWQILYRDASGNEGTASENVLVVPGS